MNYKNLRWSIITLAVIGGLSACSSDESSSGTDGSAGAGGGNEGGAQFDAADGSDVTTDGGERRGGGRSTDGSEANVGDAAILSEAQVLGVLASANQGEINEGNLAPGRASSPAVLAFAARMVTEHTAALNRVTALASSTGLTPVASPTSQALDAISASTVQALTPLSGSVFDVAYIQSQVAAHNTVLNNIDRQLLPSATTEALRSELTTTRAAVAEHLQDAQGDHRGSAGCRGR